MDRWTEEEFRRVAINTRIGARTLDACRDVLVNGASGVASIEKHKMFASQLSRALTTLRNKQAEVIAVTAVRHDAAELQQYMASEFGKALFGRDFQSSLAEPGGTYEGPVVAQTASYLVQKVGRQGVIHDLAKFEGVPPMKVELQIAYPADGGFAVFKEVKQVAKRAQLER